MSQILASGSKSIGVSASTSVLKDINAEYSLERLMQKLKFQYFDHLMQTADSLEKILMMGKIEDKRRRELAEYEMVR